MSEWMIKCLNIKKFNNNKDDWRLMIGELNNEIGN